MKRNFIVKIIILVLCIFIVSCKNNDLDSHVHSAGEVVVENIIEPTFSIGGSYEEVVYCTICNKEMSRNTIYTDKLTHEHSAGEVVIENIIESTHSTGGSYEEVVYCTICNKEMSRNTIYTCKVDYEHKESEAKIENATRPDRFNSDETVRKGYYDEVIYCEICNCVISKNRVYNYYSQYDYLELTPTINSLDNIIDLGNDRYILNTKTNNGKEVRLLIVGKFEYLEDGWGRFASNTEIYSLNSMPGINYIEHSVAYGDRKDSPIYVIGGYNFDLKDSVDNEDEVYDAGMLFQLSSENNEDEASFYFDYLRLISFDCYMDVYSLKIYYCNTKTVIKNVELCYDFMQAFIPGEAYHNSYEMNDDISLRVYWDNDEEIPYDDMVSNTVIESKYFKLGNIIDSDGNSYNSDGHILKTGDKIEIAIGDYTGYLDLCVDTFEGENLYESITTQIINSIGTQNVLVVPITFTDQLDRLNDTTMSAIKSSLGNIINDDGTITKYSIGNGNLSLSEYIYASSYGKLTINSYITSPYVIKRSGKDCYYTMFDDFYLIEEKLKKDKKIDLSMFDQNGDGYYDAMILINTLDMNKDGDGNYGRVSMSGAFVSHRSYYRDFAGTKEEPNINTYINLPLSFLYEDNDTSDYSKNIIANTLIHEFGHILGLVDYYDNGDFGINAIGGFDMQSNNHGDWNAYSKYALGWIDPIIVDGTEEEYTITLSPYSTTGQAILIHALNYDFNGTPFDEYIMLELFAHDGLYETNSEFYGLQNSVGVKIYHINSVYEQRTYENSDGTTGIIGTTHYINSSGDRYFSKGKFLIELIQNGNVNTMTSTTSYRRNIGSEDLFYENDVFTVESYDNFFYQGLMDNESEFGYKITIEKIVDDGDNSFAVIKIEKNKY